MNNEEKNRQLELLNYMYEKNYKALIDKLKIHLLDCLINLADKSERKYIFKDELLMIKEGIEEQRNKEKDEEINALVDVIDHLVGRFGK